MNIVHYVDQVSLAAGGVVRAVLDLSGVMARRGHNVTLATYDAADVPPEWTETPGEGRPTLLRIPAPARPGAFFSGGQRRAAAEAIRKAAGEDGIVHLHGVWIPTTGQVARELRAAGQPYVLSFHGMLDDWSMAQRNLKKRVYLSLVGNALLRGAGRLHATAQGEREQASRWAPGASIEVTPYVFDVEPFRELPGPDLARRELSLPGGMPIVLFLSRVHYKKRPDALIRAVAIMDRPVTLVLTGPGEASYVESLRALAEELGVADRTVFPGLVTGDAKLSLYQAADVFALPTSQENFGLVLPESLACGTPVITTKGVDIWPELEESGGATIADPTPEAFAQAIEAELADPNELARRGEAGRAWVFDYLDPDRVAQRYETMYANARSASGRRA